MKLGRMTAESSHCTVQRRQKIYRSTAALCRKHVNSVFIFGCQSWSWTGAEQNHWMGDDHDEKINSVQKKGRRDVGWVLHENGKTIARSV